MITPGSNFVGAESRGRALYQNLMFGRHSGLDFSDHDKELLTLLRPHLAEIYAGASGSVVAS